MFPSEPKRDTRFEIKYIPVWYLRRFRRTAVLSFEEPPDGISRAPQIVPKFFRIPL